MQEGAGTHVAESTYAMRAGLPDAIEECARHGLMACQGNKQRRRMVAQLAQEAALRRMKRLTWTKPPVTCKLEALTGR